MRDTKRPTVRGLEPLESRRLLAAAVGGWTPLPSLPKARGLVSDLSLTAYQPLTLSRTTIANTLKYAPQEDVANFGVGRSANSRLISIPKPDGSFDRFRIVESSIMDPALAAQFPDIKTYAGVGVDDTAARIRLDLTPLGFHAQVLTPNGDGAYYVEPFYRNNQSAYASYDGNASNARGETDADHDGHDHDQVLENPAARGVAAGRTTANGGPSVVLRNYRLAVSATGEYTAFFGGTVAAGQSAIVTAVNRVNGIYETELAVRMTLVANNSNLISTNAATDGLTNNNGGALLGENQTRVDTIIGNANYDIGHVFSTGGGGVAYLGAVGNNSIKAGGVTGLPSPTGDAFYVDYVAHEMGHQFGGNHTFNTSTDGNRNGSTAYEVGGGTTIMAYAGITGDDLQSNSDPYFAWVSVDEILRHCDVTIPSVGTRTVTANNIPTVTVSPNYTIPANTPFALTASGSDPNGDTVYYSWEEADLGPAITLETGDNGTSPLFRVYNPTTSPTRTFPQLGSILSGANSTSAPSGGLAERLPTTSRAMKFYPVVRDRRAGAGGTNVTTGTFTTVTSVAAASTFAVSNFNTATTVAGGSTQTITWNVAGTTANGINTANVQILMSTDGGNTFPTVLANSTANDGSEPVVIPNVASSAVRFKVAAVGNIYFDISNANVTVTTSTTSATPGVPDLVAATDTGVSSADNLTNRNNSVGIRSLQFDVPNTVSGATVTILADGVAIGSAVASGTTTTVTTNGITTLLDGVRNITATQTESGKSVSAASPALAVTIDTVAPALVDGAGVFEFATVKPRIVYTFNGPIVVGGPAPTVVRNSPTPATMSYSEAVTSPVATLTFPGSPNGILPNGDYTATLPVDCYRDAAGNSTAASVLNFFYAAGDANRDRTVNFNDFAILQSNYNTPQLNYTKGDFNYDGVINFDDFAILQSNNGVTV